MGDHRQRTRQKAPGLRDQGGGKAAAARIQFPGSVFFIAYAPYASRTPFELRIMPKKHQPSFADIEGKELFDFAKILKSLLARLYQGLNNPDYNFIIRSAPVGDESAKYFHWYMLIIPKLTTPAGFEIGTGIYINVTFPEQCAEFLRSIEISAP